MSRHREQSRFAARIPAKLIGRHASYSCASYNVSRNGVMLHGAFPPPAGPTVRFAMHWPGDDVELELEGNLVRVERVPGPREETILALSFDALDESETSLLECLIQRVLTGWSVLPAAALNPSASTESIRAALSDVPVPQRVAIAARAGHVERRALLADTDGNVLAALARNPQLSPLEARELAASRDALPSTLQSLAECPRFKDDEELRIVLLTNPRTALDVATACLEQLPLTAVRKALRRPGLHPSLRDRISRGLARSR